MSNEEPGKEVVRGRPRKKLKDDNAPRPPLNGYVRFLSQHRERVKQANPTQGFPDVTKILATEWLALTPDQKQIYLNEAEKDRERYNRELEEYKKTDAYSMFQQKLKDKEKSQEEAKLRSPVPKAIEKEKVTKERDVPSTSKNSSTLNIPIFTEEFLEHNKQRETELRQLRKLNTEYEEQNAILSKHIENMKVAIEKFEAVSGQNKLSSEMLEEHIHKLGAVLVKQMAGIAIPGSGETPTMDNFEGYMIKLHQTLVKEKHENKENDAIREKVQSIVCKIDPDSII